LIVLPNHIEQTYRIADDEKQRWRNRVQADRQTFVVLSAGTVRPGKNFGYLIEAFAAADAPGSRLVILGDEIAACGEMARLQKLAANKGIADRICFYGWARDPLPLFASSDLFVLPSKHEGSPNVLLEALSCGIPCLGSDLDEIREILAFDELLFPLDNHRVLGERMARACHQPDYYATIRQYSHTQCQKFRFDWHRAFSQIVTDGCQRA
jgi:glycosyltransferase involved in cell wall biosynthesis